MLIDVPAPATRGDAQPSRKRLSELTLVREPGGQCDIGQRALSVAHEVHSKLDSALDEPSVWRHSRASFESIKGARGQSASGRDSGEGDAICQVRPHHFLCSSFPPRRKTTDQLRNILVNANLVLDQLATECQ
jgi:hypothetical protein